MKALSLLPLALLPFLAPLSLSAQSDSPAPTQTQTQSMTLPRMAVAFSIGSDKARKWGPNRDAATLSGFLYELVPEGQTVDAWNEKVVQQIALTSLNLRAYLQIWEVGMRGQDPKAEFRPAPLPDGSIEVEYTAPTLKETGVRRFLQGSDGVYALAYQARGGARDDGRYKLWKGIVEAARLVPSPAAANADAAAPAPAPAPAPQDDVVAFAKLVTDHVNKEFFPPPQTTLRMLYQDVQDYMKAHPEVPAPPGDALVIQILAAKYPAPVNPAPAPAPAPAR